MISMTGYAYSEEPVDDYQITIEIKSLNNRFLDIYTDIPDSLNPYENEIRKLTTEKVTRGKIKIYIGVRELDPDMEIRLDLSLAKKYFEAYQIINKEFELDDEIYLEDILRRDDIFRTEKSKNTDKIWASVKMPFEKSLINFLQSKKGEGAATKSNILLLLGQMEKELEKIKLLANNSLEENKKKVKKRLEEMLGEYFDEQRILTEGAILASKTDINEEIERLDFHYKQFREISTNEEIVGKKLDFLTQEMLRETNTISSKAGSYEISNYIVLMKTDLEKIKEQLRNVE